MDYQSLAMDRIVLNEGDVSIDTAEAEANLQRLANECENNPNAPNLLLNMLEMMHHEQAQVSSKIRQQIFKQVVQSKNVKLLKKAEDLIVWKNRQDPNLLRLLIAGYIHASAPEKASNLLLKWTQSEPSPYYPAPSINSYRLVLTALAKKGDHIRALELLQHLCSGQQQQHEPSVKSSSTLFLSRSSSTTNDKLLPAPDRDCFLRVLMACDKSRDDTTFETARQVMQLMTPQPGENGVSNVYHHAVVPTRSSIRLFLKVWQRSNDPQERQMLREKAFDWLRDMERNAMHDSDVTAATSTFTKSIPDVQCYNLVLNSLAEDGRYQQAEAYLHRMLTEYLKGQSIVQPDDVSLHTVLKAHAQASTVEAAEAAELLLGRIDEFAKKKQELVASRRKRRIEDRKPQETNEISPELMMRDESLEEQRRDVGTSEHRFAELQPQARAYTILIAFWLKLGEPDRAIAVLEKAEKLYRVQCAHNGKQATHFRPDVTCYRSIVTALSKLNPVTADTAIKAQSVAQQMVQVRHRPDLLLCNIVLSIWVKAGRPQEAEDFLENYMVQDYRVFDIISYNTVIQGYCNAENCLNRAIELLEKMTHPGPTNDSFTLPLPNPNTRTFTSILTALAKEKTVNAAMQAEEMILEMQELYENRKMDTQPNVFSFNAVLNCWASLSHADRKNSRKHGRRSIEILEGMKGTKEGPDVISYNTCIRAQRNDVVASEKLLKEMIINGIYPNDFTWKTLTFVLKHDNRIKTKEEKADELRRKYFSHLDAKGRNGSKKNGSRTRHDT
jgi:pentatricopeptide repeat protein